LRPEGSLPRKSVWSLCRVHANILRIVPIFHMSATNRTLYPGKVCGTADTRRPTVRSSSISNVLVEQASRGEDFEWRTQRLDSGST